MVVLHAPSLCDALLDLRCVPATAEPSERQYGAAVARLVVDVVARFAGMERVSHADRDDIVMVVATRLAERGPRRAQPNMPTDDAGAAGYLRRAVRNAAKDVWRAQERRRDHDSMEQAEGSALEHAASQAGGGAPDAEQALSTREDTAARDAAVADAQEWLGRQVTALVAVRNHRRKGSGDALARQLDELWRAARGDLDIGELTRSQAPPGADSATLKRVRNKLDAGYKRARRALYDHVEMAIASDAYPRPELVRWVFRQRVSLQ